ncbi:MAG: hypothetical protein IJ675_07505 [Pseudobutyrivibrio sp.]|nr:hypothetical protein [Pseudobutyrivibrio sp.]
MDIIRLEKEQMKYFADMDPFLLGERLDLPNYFAVGALVHNKSKNTDVPMGLMICSMIEQGLVVEWICVGERFRSYGIGEKLLIAAFDLAAELGTGKIFAYINELSESFTESQLMYLKDRLFSEEYPVLGERKAPLGEMVADEAALKGDNYNIVAFSAFPEKGRKKAFEDFVKLDNTLFNYPFELEDEGYDSKKSFLLLDKDRICGGLFTKQVGQTIHVTAISMNTVEAGEALFAKLIAAVKKDADPKIEVSLLIRQKPKTYDWYEEPADLVDYTSIEAVANKVFNKKHSAGRYLAASIYAYMEHIGEDVELEAWDDLAYEELEEA